VVLDKARVVVAGIGNEAVGDDAAGVQVARALSRETLPPNVTVHETGMVGFRMIDIWAGADLCMVVDAMDSGEAPGAIWWFDGPSAVLQCLSERESLVSSHECHLKEVIELGTVLGPPFSPNNLAVFGVQVDCSWLGFGRLELSPSVQKACHRLSRIIADMLVRGSLLLSEWEKIDSSGLYRLKETNKTR